MSKTDYTKLDATLLALIGARAGIAFQLISGDSLVEFEAASIAAEENKGKRGWNEIPGWRIVDRRLQGLRKAGKIRYQRKAEGWVPT